MREQIEKAIHDLERSLESFKYARGNAFTGIYEAKSRLIGALEQESPARHSEQNLLILLIEQLAYQNLMAGLDPSIALLALQFLAGLQSPNEVES